MTFSKKYLQKKREKARVQREKASVKSLIYYINRKLVSTFEEKDLNEVHIDLDMYKIRTCDPNSLDELIKISEKYIFPRLKKEGFEIETSFSPMTYSYVITIKWED